MSPFPIALEWPYRSADPLRGNSSAGAFREICQRAPRLVFHQSNQVQAESRTREKNTLRAGINPCACPVNLKMSAPREATLVI